MSGLELIGTVLGGLGTAASVAGTIAQGRAQNAAAQFEAKQMDMKAKEETAAAQREAEQKRREGLLVGSRQQALAAASGGGAGSDAPTIVKLMSETAGQAEYNAQSEMFGGTQRAAGLVDSARARRLSGKASLLGSNIAATGQALAGFGKVFGGKSFG